MTGGRVATRRDRWGNKRNDLRIRRDASLTGDRRIDAKTERGPEIRPSNTGCNGTGRSVGDKRQGVASASSIFWSDVAATSCNFSVARAAPCSSIAKACGSAPISWRMAEQLSTTS